MGKVERAAALIDIQEYEYSLVLEQVLLTLRVAHLKQVQKRDPALIAGLKAQLAQLEKDDGNSI